MKTIVCAAIVGLLVNLVGACATEKPSGSDESAETDRNDDANESEAGSRSDDSDGNQSQDEEIEGDASEAPVSEDGETEENVTDDDALPDEEDASMSNQDVGSDAAEDSVTPWLQEAIAICAWRTSCLGSPRSVVGTLPDTTLEACVDALAAQQPSGGGSALFYPVGEAADCVHQNPASCDEFRACMIDKQAVCPTADPEVWALGSICEAGTRSCSTCEQACTEEGQTCSPDGTRLDACEGGVYHTYSCSALVEEGHCFPTPSGDWCQGGEIGTCTDEGGECQGSVAVRCFGGVSVSTDCAELGRVCEYGACANDTQCGYDNVSECDGDVLLANCLSGRVVDVDCAVLGGRCGRLSSGWNGCVFAVNAGEETGTDDSSSSQDSTTDATEADTDTDTADAETTTDDSSNGTNCADMAAQNAQLSDDLGCDQNPDLEANCEELYASDTCVAEWEAMISCFGIFSADDFYCNEENVLKPQPTNCQTQREAFDSCIK